MHCLDLQVCISCNMYVVTFWFLAVYILFSVLLINKKSYVQQSTFEIWTSAFFIPWYLNNQSLWWYQFPFPSWSICSVRTRCILKFELSKCHFWLVSVTDSNQTRSKVVTVQLSSATSEAVFVQDTVKIVSTPLL